MAQLVERSPPTPEARLSNPVIGQKITLNVYCQLPSILTKIKKKEAGNGPFFVNRSSNIISFTYMLHNLLKQQLQRMYFHV